jgi:hypothetical protein
MSDEDKQNPPVSLPPALAFSFEGLSLPTRRALYADMRATARYYWAQSWVEGALQQAFGLSSVGERATAEPALPAELCIAEITALDFKDWSRSVLYCMWQITHRASLTPAPVKVVNVLGRLALALHPKANMPRKLQLWTP